MVQTIGVVGLGIMGAPMAAKLVAAGYDVIGFNRSPGPMRSLEDAGGRAAGSAAALAREAEIVIMVLPDSPDVETVALGPDGLIANMLEGSLLIDCSTISPHVARAVASAAIAAGIEMVDAPVSGGETGAKEAKLSIMVGGSPSAFDRAHPILRSLGTTVEHVGASGAGQTVKAANQLLVAGQLALVAEAITLLQASEVDMDSGLRVLGGGLAASRVLAVKAPAMLAHQFDPGFRIDLHCKDLGIVLDLAARSGVELTVSPLVERMFSAAQSDGLGALDHSAIIIPMLQGVRGGAR